MYIDYSKLIAVTSFDIYTISRTNDYIVSMGNTTEVSTLNSKLVYWPIRVAEKDKKRHVLTTVSVTYSFERMLFEHINILATFQRALDNIVNKYTVNESLVWRT